MGAIEPVIAELRTGERVAIRTPTPDEAPQILAFLRETFATTDTVLTQADEFTMTEQEERDLLASRLAAPTGLQLLACREDGRIICCAALEPQKKRRTMHNVTLGIMSAAEYRGKGAGDLVMRELMQYARANPKIRRVLLEVVEANVGAVRLYERHGFVVEGVNRGEFCRRPGVYENSLRMACYVDEGKA